MEQVGQVAEHYQRAAKSQESVRVLQVQRYDTLLYI